MFGIAGTAHESVCAELGLDFVAEFSVDLAYDDEGMIVVERRPTATDLDLVARRAEDAIVHGVLTTANGHVLPVAVESVCVHSDLPTAADVARTVRRVLDQAQAG